MPRQADPELEERILKAARVLWKRGGEKSLTMRAVARGARTNTPAVYRRFKHRRDILRALLRDIQKDIGEHFRAGESIEEMAEAYIEYALDHPHEYELFYTHARELAPRQKTQRPQAIREWRPNVGLVEDRLARRLGGSPEEYTRMALALWAVVHGTAMMLLSETIPGHEWELRDTCRAAVSALLEVAPKMAAVKSTHRISGHRRSGHGR
jgi:AcrR family transcriptional regulator